jgi:hypothetical protein
MMIRRGGHGVGRRQQAKLEQRVRQAAQTGQLLNLGTGILEQDDPARGATWAAARTVGAELVVELLTTTPGDERLRAIKLQGVRITGPLDLEAATLACPVLLQGCFLDEQVVLRGATAVAVRLLGCHLPGLAADQFTTRSNLELNRGCTIHGEVRLVDARIGGTLDCDGGHFINPEGCAIDAAGLTVAGAMFCGERFIAHGEVRLLGAHIGGQLACNGGHFTNSNGRAIDGELLAVDQSMFCGAGFIAHGEVRLLGAHIGGQFGCDGGQFINPDGPALTGEQLTVDQGVFCGAGFTARGEVRLLGGHIGGQLECSGGHFTNPGGYAFIGDGLTVDQGMFCAAGFTSRGEVRLVHAHVNGQLGCDGGRFTNPNGIALNGDRLTVDGDLFCRTGFSAKGEVRLVGAHISGQLVCDGGRFTNPNGHALNLEGTSAAQLVLLPRERPDGAMSLINAQVGSLVDAQGSWPQTVYLRGFIYDRLENDQVTVRERLRWLRRDPTGYSPQPYEQLAAAHRRAGDEQAARRVAIAKQWRRRRVLSPWNWLLYLTIGYGYRTWLAGLWLAAFLLAGTILFAVAHSHQLLTAAKPAQELQHFNPLVYALDVLLPIVNLGQEGGWVAHRWAAVAYWALILVGWVLTTAVVAGLTGVLKRD